MDIDQQLVQAVKNLDAMDKKAVPKAAAMAINRIAGRALSHSVKDTSKAVSVVQKVVRRYARISKKASAKMPVAFIRVRRTDIPAIHIASVRFQVRKRKGKEMISDEVRGKDGRYQKREISGYTAIRVGRHKFENAFLQRLKSGRWHIMQRTSDKKYPIKLCAIPIHSEITNAFKTNSNKLIKTDMPKELNAAMGQMIRLYVRREVGRGH